MDISAIGIPAVEITASFILLCVFLVFVGFSPFVGFVRGMNKSVIRLITLVFAAVLTFFASALVTNLIADKLLIEGQTLGELILAQISSQEMVVNFLESAPLLKEAILAAPAFAMAIVIFPVMFFLLSFISWLVFCCIQKPLRKKMFKEQFPKDKKEKKALKKQRKPFIVRLGKRFVGLGVGAVTGALIFGMLIAPILGVISILPENTALYEVIDTMVDQEILEAETAQQIKDGIAVRDEAILKSYRLIGLSLAGKLYLSSVSQIEYEGQKTNIPAEFDSVFSVAQVAIEGGLLKAVLDSENPKAIFTVLSNQEFVDALIGEMFNSRIFCAAIPEVMAMAMESVALSLKVPADKNAVYNNMMDDIASSVKDANVNYDGIKAYEAAQVAADYVAADEAETPVIMTKEEYEAEIQKLADLTLKISKIINTAVAGSNENIANTLAGHIVEDIKSEMMENGNDALEAFNADSVKTTISEISADSEAQEVLTKMADPEKFETDVATVETIKQSIRESVQSAVADTSKAQETASTLASVVCNLASAVDGIIDENGNIATDENGNVDIGALDFTKIADAVTGLQNSNLKDVGSSMLDLVVAGDLGDNGELISTTIGALKDSYNNGEDIGGTINSAGALIIIGSSMGTDGGSKEDIAKSFKDLVQNLNETTLNLLSTVLSEDTLISMGVKKAYAEIAFDVVDALLRELMELKNSSTYDDEVNTVLSIYDILSAGKVGDDQMADLVRQMLKSQVVMNTMDRVSTDILSAELLISLDVPEKYADEICTAVAACVDEMLAIRNSDVEDYNAEIDAFVSMVVALDDKNLTDKELAKELVDFAKDSDVIYNALMKVSDSIVIEVDEDDRADIKKGIEEYYAESGKTEKERAIFNAVAKLFAIEVTLQ
ncbi:MAG: hypothetical protein IKM00_00890 [Clostridia bacterium]|nr:hypothetical protein [Clostridia bacterium]